MDPKSIKYPGRNSTGHTCPRCGSDLYIYRSSVRNFWEKIKRWVGLHPFRCDPCGHRFFAPKDPKKMKRKNVTQ